MPHKADGFQRLLQKVQMSLGVTEQHSCLPVQRGVGFQASPVQVGLHQAAAVTWTPLHEGGVRWEVPAATCCSEDLEITRWASGTSTRVLQNPLKFSTFLLGTAGSNIFSGTSINLEQWLMSHHSWWPSRCHLVLPVHMYFHTENFLWQTRELPRVGGAHSCLLHPGAQQQRLITME